MQARGKAYRSAAKRPAGNTGRFWGGGALDIILFDFKD